MAILQTKKQSDLEKRIKLLRQQVYGKSSEHSENSVSQKDQYIRISDTPSHSVPMESGYSSFRTDISYLHQDLLKIVVLASLAIGTQIILFILFSNNILKINLF